MTGTAFQIPVISEVVPRPRLRELLAGAGQARIILVTGQAAQGKTTMVADYLNQDPGESLWFHLSARAEDNTFLFDLISKGLDRIAADPDPSLSTPHITLGSRQDLLRQTEILTGRMAQIQGRVNLILDDMESLTDPCPALDLIQHLLAESPPHIRFFLLSRQRPTLNLSRFKMQKALLEMTNEDLAFTLDETRSFFSGNDLVRPLDARAVERIRSITSGWAGGLVLVSEAVRRCQDLDRLPAHLSSEAFSYFSQEIYQHLPPKTREFLAVTSLFEELDTRILGIFFGSQTPVSLLQQLEDRNLFIQKTAPGKAFPVFRYNNLFREFLQADLAQTQTCDQIARLNRSIGEVFWQEKDHEKAIPYFLAAGDAAMVARILRIKGADYVITGRADRMADWIRSLPQAEVRSDPWLIFFATMAQRIKGGKENILAFSQTLESFSRSGDTRGILLSLAYLIEAAVFIRQPSAMLRKWIRAGEEALAGLGGRYRFTWARTLLWQQIGLGYIAGTGDIPKGISACRNAILLAQGIDNRDLVLNASVVLTLGLVQSGDFAGARNLLKKKSASLRRHPEYRALETITDIDMALKRGDTARAGKLLASFEADIETFGLIFLYPGFVEARAVYHASVGQYDLAIQSADHLSDFSVLEGNDFYLGISHRIKAMVSLLQGDADRAVAEGERAVAELGSSKRGNIHLYLARQILGTGLYRQGRGKAAAAELAAAAGYFSGIRSDLSFCETVFVQGLLAADDPDGGKKAALFFRDGLEKAVENRYRYFPLLDRSLLAKVFVTACRCLDDPDNALVPYVRLLDDPELLGLIRQEVNDAMAGMGKTHGTGSVNSYIALFKAACPKFFVATLGSFALTRGKEMVQEFGGAKPLMLLKTIVFNRAKDVPKEVLIDALWPEASEAAGEKNLKINLHRLRKALEPAAEKAIGPVYLIQKSGRVSLDPDLVSLDILAFEKFCTRGRQYEAAEDWDAALDCYARAAGLYRGDFFQDDPDLDPMGTRAAVFRRNCIEILSRKSAIHEELSQWEAAVDTWNRVLEIDSCHEDAYQNLMILYGDRGRKTDAAQVFARCEAALRSELDTSPGQRTLDILHRILGA